MKILTVDQKRRLVLPGARPGEAFSVFEKEPGHYELSKVMTIPRGAKPSRAMVEERMKKAGLTPAMTWEELRSNTREP